MHWLRAQGAHLLCRVVYADLAIVVAAEGNLAARQDLVAVVRRGIGQKEQQVLFGGSRADQLARAAQRKAVTVPAGGKIVENVALSVPVGKVLQNAQHGVAAQTAKARHAHGDAARSKTFGENVTLNGDGFLTVQARS